MLAVAAGAAAAVVTVGAAVAGACAAVVAVGAAAGAEVAVGVAAGAQAARTALKPARLAVFRKSRRESFFIEFSFD
jgi:hypothetical protein